MNHDTKYVKHFRRYSAESCLDQFFKHGKERLSRVTNWCWQALEAALPGEAVLLTW